LEGHFKEQDMAKAPDWLDDDIQEFYPVYNGGIMAIQAAIGARRGVKIAYMTVTEHMKKLGLERPREKSKREKVHRSTPADHQDTPKAHPSTPEDSERWMVHPGTPESPEIGREEQYPQEHPEPPAHQGTLEGHQEVMEDISQSVPDALISAPSKVYQYTRAHLKYTRS
jgi:hypothetical protein